MDMCLNFLPWLRTNFSCASAVQLNTQLTRCKLRFDSKKHLVMTCVVGEDLQDFLFPTLIGLVRYGGGSELCTMKCVELFLSATGITKIIFLFPRFHLFECSIVVPRSVPQLMCKHVQDEHLWGVYNKNSLSEKSRVTGLFGYKRLEDMYDLDDIPFRSNCPDELEVSHA